MKREEFKQIIKFRSFWKIDRRKGDYKLPNGERLSDYVRRLVESQMDLDNLAISCDGNFKPILKESYWDTSERCFTDIEILTPFGENETCSLEEQARRVTKLVFEII